MTPAEQRARFEEATRGYDPPLALVDLDAFDRNAAELVRRGGGRPIRVATKSLRVRALIERTLARDGFSGLMCYALREALWLSGSGTCDDILVGYPTVDVEALRQLAADERARGAITLMVDSLDQLAFIDHAVGTPHPVLRVCLELDASWRPLGSPSVHVGVRRSPVFTREQAITLAQEIIARPGFRLVGLMAYEAQIAGLGDSPEGRPALSFALKWMQRRSASELAERRGAVVAGIRALTELEFVNGGGTGSLERTAADPSVTELTAGSGLFAPTLFDDYAHFRPEPALVFALPVVRKPTPRIATVFSGGYVASGAAGPSRLPRPYLPEGLLLIQAEGAGEVQTPLVGEAAQSLHPGDRVWMRPAKAGELAERFDRYHLLRGADPEGEAPTYRGEGRCFG